MTKAEKQKYLEMKSVGYAASLTGLEVKAVEYGIEDMIIFTFPTVKGGLSVHSAKIKYDKERPYFRFEDYQVYVDEIMRF